MLYYGFFRRSTLSLSTLNALAHALDGSRSVRVGAWGAAPGPQLTPKPG